MTFYKVRKEKVFILLFFILVFLYPIEVKAETESKREIIYDKVTIDSGGERIYDWYIDQSTTGLYSTSNCWPASVVMVLKWLNRNFDSSVEEAREEIRDTYGYCYTNELYDYLVKYEAEPLYKQYTGVMSIKEVINNKGILIVCIDYSYLGDFTGGHFLIIHGYRETEDGLVWVTHDPLSNGLYVFDEKQDYKLIGNNREFRAEDMDRAILNRWPLLIVVKDNK